MGSKAIIKQANFGAMLAGLCIMAATAAASGPGTTGADVLKVNLGARPNALGGAYSAVGNDAQSLLYNPASLATVQGSDAVFQHYAAYAEVTYELLGYVQPVEDMGMVGGTLVWRTMPAIDNPGAPDAPVAVNDLVLTIGEGRYWKELFGSVPPLLDRLSVGAAVKLIYSSLREAHAVSVAADLGAVWNAPLGVCPSRWPPVCKTPARPCAIWNRPTPCRFAGVWVWLPYLGIRAGTRP